MQGIPIYSLPLPHKASPTPPVTNFPQQNGASVTTDEPAWRRHSHPRPPLVVEFALGVVPSMGSGECVTTSVRHYGLSLFY